MRPLVPPLVLTALFLAAPGQAAFQIVAHPELEVDSISRSELSRIFQKKLRTWANGQAALPVDQPVNSEVREEFSQLVHERSVLTLEVYWKRMIFSGRSLPPPILANDDEVLDYVRATPGAVGYVDADADTAGVKKLALTE